MLEYYVAEMVSRVYVGNPLASSALIALWDTEGKKTPEWEYDEQLYTATLTVMERVEWTNIMKILVASLGHLGFNIPLPSSVFREEKVSFHWLSVQSLSTVHHWLRVYMQQLAIQYTTEQIALLLDQPGTDILCFVIFLSTLFS